METIEREMVRKLRGPEKVEDRSTSLQPTYEDSVPPDADEAWQYEDEVS